MDRGRVKPESGLNLRNTPNGDVVSVLYFEEEVELLETVTFYRVKRHNGEVGYAHGDYLEASPHIDSKPEPKKTPSEFFDIVQFQNDYFIGEIAKVDRDFIPTLNLIAEFAKNHSVKVWVTSSLRSMDNQIKGAIVAPASKSCHHIGHAIDMNIWHDGKLYNSKAMHPANLSQLPKSVSGFIQDLQRCDQLRWGGDFGHSDPVHIDDDFYHKQSLLYTAKLQDRIQKLTA